MLNNIGLPGLLVFVIFAILLIVPWWKIWSRSGHRGWMGVLMVIPLVNLVMLWDFALKRWPALEAQTGIEKRFE